LAAQPLLRGCTRREIRHLAHVGDECFVPAGTVLAHEGRIGYWFFVVEEGSVALTREGAAVATVGPGSHLGEVAILGFGPQPVTATATVDSSLYVLGRRHLLDLSHELDGLRAGLFPGLDLAAFRERVRVLRAEGDAAWRQTQQRRRPTTVAFGREVLPAGFQRFPSRRGPGLPAGPSSPPTAPGPAVRSPATPRPLDRRVVAALVLAVVAGVLATGFGYHPGTLVIRPDPPIDITDDVVVEGVPTRPARARYVLTAVSVTEPHAFGLVGALWSGEQTLPNDHPATPASREAGREEFRAAQREASRLAGLDPTKVRFRERDVVGPSAGLVYALLLADVTGHLDVPDGRVVAATGVVDEEGRVLPVSFVSVKLRVAARAGADVFVVPSGQGVPGRPGMRVVSAPSLEAARAAAAAR
jgi:PDZ domain-containing protein